jgi:transposase
LKYGTVQQNTSDAVRDGLIQVGEKAVSSILTNKDVYEIKYLLVYTKIPINEIAKIYEVGKGTVLDINKKRTWNHLNPEIPLRKDKSLSKEIVKKIKKLLIDGSYLQKEIANLFGVSTSTISAINMEVTYKNIK